MIPELSKLSQLVLNFLQTVKLKDSDLTQSTGMSDGEVSYTNYN